MNKFLRLSFIGLLLGLCTAGWADTKTFDFTGSEAYGMTLLSGSTSEYNADPCTLKEGDVSISLQGQTRWWKATSNNELRFYKGSKFTVSVPTGYAISKIVLTAKTPANFSATIGTYDKGTWTGSANSVDISCTIAKKNTPISKIEVTYASSSTPVKQEPNLKFSEETITINQGDAFTAPTFTKSTTADVTFASDNEGVATVNAEGVISLGTEIGTAVITATAAENDDYNAGTATCTIKVLPAVATEVTLPYEETFADAIGSFTIDDVNLGEGLTYVWKHDTEYKYMKASAYNKKNIASESWLVSPTINLNGISTATLSFEQCISKYFGTVSEEATLWVKEEGGAWQQITITYPEIPDGKNWSAMEKHSDISLDDYAGEKIKIGFKYVSTDAAAGTWEIKNFKVTGVATNINGITENAANENAPIYNLAGQRVNKNAKGILIQNGKKFVNK